MSEFSTKQSKNTHCLNTAAIYFPKIHADTHAHNQTTHTIKNTIEKSLSLYFDPPKDKSTNVVDN
jgi:hypothetical protein